MLQRTAASLCDDGLMMVPKENASIEVVQSNVRSPHTAPQEVGLGSGRAFACGLSVLGAVGDGCRYSFLLSSAPIHCCDRSAYCPEHVVVFEIISACYN